MLVNGQRIVQAMPIAFGDHIQLGQQFVPADFGGQQLPKERVFQESLQEFLFGGLGVEAGAWAEHTEVNIYFGLAFIHLL